MVNTRKNKQLQQKYKTVDKAKHILTSNLNNNNDEFNRPEDNLGICRHDTNAASVLALA